MRLKNNGQTVYPNLYSGYTVFLTMYLDRNDKYHDLSLQDEDQLENRTNTPGREKGSLHSNDTVH
ncbi:hypothetical protein YWY31_30230 [Paenibacillus illinoisensis]